jgi:transcriptional regulator with XRE-family HTH domain
MTQWATAGEFVGSATCTGEARRSAGDDSAHIGARIRQLRLSANYTRGAFARILRVTPATVENWERGTGIAQQSLFLISEKTGAPVDWLRTGRAENGPDTPGDSAAARLKQARIDAGFSSASAAAREFGWKICCYLPHENGAGHIGEQAAAKYAIAFKTDSGRLLWGWPSPSSTNGTSA